MAVEINDIIQGVGSGLQAYANAADDSMSTGYNNSTSNPIIVEETEEDYTLYYIIGGILLLIIAVVLFLKFK